MKKTAILLLGMFLLTSTLAFEFCDEGTVGEDNIRIISVDDMLKENFQEWQWEASQNIELEIRVENKNDNDETYALEAVFKDGEKTVRIATDSNDLEKEFTLGSDERKSISLQFELEDDLDPENYDLFVKLYQKNNEDEECVENSEEKIEIIKIEVCDDEEVDEDELEITRIKDNTEDNEKEWVWAPQNNIRLTAEFENKEYSERDFEIELVFFNENNEEVQLARDSSNVRETKNLEEDESEDVSFEFKIDSDTKEGKYTLYAKLYDEENPDICTSLKAETKSDPIMIKIEKEERKVIVTKVEGPTNLSTSSTAKYNVTLENLGSKNEEKVQAVLYNNNLGLKEKISINDLESGKKKTITFEIKIPENVSEDKYPLLFSTEYEYSKTQDFYKSESDSDDDIKYYLTIYKSQEEIKEEVTTEETQEENETQATEENTTAEEENTTIKEDDTTYSTSSITGNAIGTDNTSKNWITGIIMLVLAGLIIALFFLKKSNSIQEHKEMPEPKITRRYKARL